MTEQLVSTFRSIVGQRHVLVGDRSTRRYRKGYRYGDGQVLAVVRPGTLVEKWRALKACVEAGVIVIIQAANTGLTGGSTPFGDGYDRPIVIINTMRISRVDLISGGSQVIALPGATLDKLEKTLRPVGREPHSVIGSSCIGASVTGGVCNNSGGSLIQRGPAYTELALYAQVDETGTLRLVNHLGVDLGDEAETVLSRLDAGQYSDADVTPEGNRRASDHDYHRHVRDIEADTPARFNADPRKLFEASGSAGKLAVFALRLDTFAADTNTQVFYIGSNDPLELNTIRRHMLSRFTHLPIAGEYLHRDAYTLTQRYGKDTFLIIKRFGTDRIPTAFAAKSWVDGITEKLGLGGTVSDRMVQAITGLLPQHLPKRMNDYRDRFEHHLMIRMGGDGVAEARSYLKGMFPSASGDYFECTPQEGTDAFLHRFAVGGAAVRYRNTHPHDVEDILALDVALPRNEIDWLPELPADLDAQIEYKVLCGHFFCHVMHQDYMIKKGVDVSALKEQLLALLDTRGAEYPAEHNVGHLYAAKPALADFYKTLDPTNSFNPGIGKTSKKKQWA
ncbi:MAG TPA: D-lactate dehydrogenase [Pelagibacterium sp.]|uniref:D-lactate dehydrogenase n=1 Tax=uncultured Pelagibacterium sp. TaxID=1159875 RepID=UPI000ED2ED6D|nr:D-lactate dehydrogenase [Pelagibacterium sp.]|tara:strand:+ start:2466 stop:4151 length:1686 start_codon:yes stop_codon:yes gene_type:complete